MPGKATTAKSKDDAAARTVTISPPRLGLARFELVGSSPLVIHRFSGRALQKLRETQERGSQARSRRIREPRDFEADFLEAAHIATEGWYGVHAGALRAALISACKLVGFHMSKAKLAIFPVPDGFDKVDHVPLLRIDGPPPEMLLMAARNASGVVDLRARPQWREWKLHPRIIWDRDQFSLDDITNLLIRAGTQVGIGEGRYDSRESFGLGWGTFDVADVTLLEADEPLVDGRPS